MEEADKILPATPHNVIVKVNADICFLCQLSMTAVWCLMANLWLMQTFTPMILASGLLVRWQSFKGDITQNPGRITQISPLVAWSRFLIALDKLAFSSNGTVRFTSLKVPSLTESVQYSRTSITRTPANSDCFSSPSGVRVDGVLLYCENLIGTEKSRVRWKRAFFAGGD